MRRRKPIKVFFTANPSGGKVRKRKRGNKTKQRRRRRR